MVIVEISGTLIMTESSIRLVVVITTTVLVILMTKAGSMCLMLVVRMVWSFVLIWILPIAACRIRGVCCVVMWSVVLPWPWCFSGWWGWLDVVGARFDLVNCSCGCAVQHVVFTLLDHMGP